MQTWFYLQPATVSFQNLDYWEQAGSNVNTGVWSCLANHTPGPAQNIGAVIAGLGSEVLAYDSAYFEGPCQGYAAPFVASTATQYIPNVYAVAYNAGTDSAYNGPTSAPFVTITQAATLNSAGALTIQKGSATAGTTVSSATSTFPPETPP